jgi:ferric iron reductase protein FhuF
MTLDPPTTVDAVLATVADHVSYLRASTQAPEADGWIRCAELCRPGDPLDGLLTSTGTGLGTDDPQVAASLFVQGYAFRVGGVALAAFALDLPTPAVAPDVTAITIGRHRPNAIAHTSPLLADPDADRLAAALLGGHLAPLVAAVRAEVRVGERMLWGNVAAACAVAFRAVESSGTDRVAVRARADAFMAAARPWLDGLGGFSTIVVDDRDGWFWTRTSCCLWYQASGGQLCDDCSLIPADELLARRRSEVAGSAS